MRRSGVLAACVMVLLAFTVEQALSGGTIFLKPEKIPQGGVFTAVATACAPDGPGFYPAVTFKLFKPNGNLHSKARDKADDSGMATETFDLGANSPIGSWIVEGECAHWKKRRGKDKKLGVKLSYSSRKLTVNPSV